MLKTISVHKDAKHQAQKTNLNVAQVWLIFYIFYIECSIFKQFNTTKWLIINRIDDEHMMKRGQEKHNKGASKKEKKKNYY